MACRRYSHLKEGMAPGSERHPNLDWGRVSSGSPILSIRAVAPVRAVSARGWIIRIHRTHTAARAVRSIAAVHPAGAAASGEIRYEVVVVPQGNIELGAEGWMARHCDGDMRQLSLADPGIMAKGHNAFLVDGYNICCNLEILPQDLSMTCAFRLYDLAVWLSYCHHQRRLLSRRDARAFWQVGLD